MIQDPTHYQPHTYFHSKKTLKTHQINSFVQLFKGKKKGAIQQNMLIYQRAKKKKKNWPEALDSSFLSFHKPNTRLSLFNLCNFSLPLFTRRWPALLSLSTRVAANSFFFSVGSQRNIKTAASSISFFFEEVPPTFVMVATSTFYSLQLPSLCMRGKAFNLYGIHRG